MTRAEEIQAFLKLLTDLYDTMRVVRQAAQFVVDNSAELKVLIQHYSHRIEVQEARDST